MSNAVPKEIQIIKKEIRELGGSEPYALFTTDREQMICTYPDVYSQLEAGETYKVLAVPQVGSRQTFWYIVDVLSRVPDAGRNCPETAKVDGLLMVLGMAERKAWEALAKCRFQMFGYWASVWLHMNRLGNYRRPNPWIEVAVQARAHRVTAS